MKSELHHEQHLERLGAHPDVVAAYDKVGYPLSAEFRRLFLEEEVFDNRKGSGFTQVTYKLLGGHDTIDTIFAPAMVEKLYDQREQHFRATDEYREIDTFLDHSKLIAVLDQLQDSSSCLFARLLLDRYFPYQPQPDDVVLQKYRGHDRLVVGACTSAELYYAEFVNDPGRYRWRNGESGAMNVITQTGEPILIEKENLGDSYSCLTLTDVVVRGMRLPAGTLLAVSYDQTQASREHINSAEKIGSKEIPLAACAFSPLRLTTFAVEPHQRAKAFGVHYQWQKSNRIPGYDIISIADLRERASAMLLAP